MERIGWKYTRSFFGPFYKTNMIAIKTVLNAGPYCLLFILEPVQIDMKDHAAGKRIFIDDGKSRTAYYVLNSFYLAKRMNKCGLACPQTPMKCDHFFIADSSPEVGGSFSYIIQFIDNVHRAKVFGDLQQGVEDYQLVNRLAGH